MPISRMNQQSLDDIMADLVDSLNADGYAEFKIESGDDQGFIHDLLRLAAKKSDVRKYLIEMNRDVDGVRYATVEART